MQSHTFQQVRWRLRLALVLCVIGAFPDGADAAAVRVGLDAGEPGSQCQFDRLQSAIDSLPNDGELHTVQLQADAYVRPVDTVRVTGGRRVRIISLYTAGSGCTQVDQAARARIAPATSTLESGRQVVALDDADLELQRVIVSDGSNGALLIRDARITLRDVQIENQTTPAQASGAGAVVEGGSLRVIDSVFEGNRAGANGGALFCTRSTSKFGQVVVASDSAFVSNRGRHGGAMYLFRGCILRLLDAPLFMDNAANVDGGAIGTEPVAGGADQINTIEIAAAARFIDNQAGRDGGAVELDAGNALDADLGSVPQFVENRAGRAGGALLLAGSGPEVFLAGALFQDNAAASEGGAIVLRQRTAMLLADCSSEPESEDYCALFRNNAVPSNVNETRRGGAISIDDGGAMLVEGYAFRDSRGPRSLNGESGGVIASMSDGSLHLANALVFDSGPGLESDSHLFLVQPGGTATVTFSTMVDAPGGSAMFIQPGGTARLAGNIIAGNIAGVINGGGTLTGTCNNVQLGTAPAPVDPGFVTTPQGRYRLAPGSAMRNGALGCDPDRLPPGFRAPRVDLLGRDRIEAGEQPMAIDLGAIEFRPRDERVFGDGFEGELP